MNKITIWEKNDDITIFKCRKNTSEGNYTPTDDIENIQNKIAKRIILLTESDIIKWRIDNNILRPEYVTLTGIGTAGNAVNFKYKLHINKTSIDKSYFMYVGKNMVNDWEILYPFDFEGNCIFPEQEIFIQKILNALELKGVLVWLKGDYK